MAEVHDHSIHIHDAIQRITVGDSYLERLSPATAIWFWEHVRVGATPDACWRWEGDVNPDGYGFLQIKLDGEYTITTAHRLSYQLQRGQLSPAYVIDHLCRNRGCVNPAHLEPVTNRENIQRGIRSRAGGVLKVTCKRGHAYVAGKRYCLECRANATLRWRARKRQAAAVSA